METMTSTVSTMNIVYTW